LGFAGSKASDGASLFRIKNEVASGPGVKYYKKKYTKERIFYA